MRDLVCFFDIDAYKEAKRLFGIDEIVFVSRFEAGLIERLRKQAVHNKLDVKFCHIVERGNLKRNKADFLAIEVKELKDLNFASHKAIRFVLFNPKAKVDLQAIKMVAGSEKEIVFSFSELLNASAFERALILKKMRLVAKLAKKAKANVKIYSLAHNAHELRNPKSLQCILACTGD
ncbi:MAG: hypothetical protein J7L44_04180 [Candidatus Diapherotrites archaeon]|nr:hypothetical protein [Candidatus Diapherotrites archaeon]